MVEKSVNFFLGNLSLRQKNWGTSLWCFSQLKLPRKNTNHHLSKYLSLQIPRTLWASFSSWWCWWFSPRIWKICAVVKLDHLPKHRGEISKSIGSFTTHWFFFGNSGTSRPSMGPPLVFHTWDLPSEIVCTNCCRFNSTNKNNLPKKLRQKFKPHILKIQVTTVGFN